MGRGVAMPSALYKQNDKFIPIKAVNVDPRNKQNIWYYCDSCRKRVIHTKGNKETKSKPYFRKAPNVDHEDGCFYKKKSTLEDIIQEVGTLENVNYDIKPPLSKQRNEKTMPQGDEEVKGEIAEKELKTITTRINRRKKTTRNILTVDELFHELMDIGNLEKDIRKKLFSRIIRSIYYPYANHDLLIKDYESKSMGEYFFTAGNLYKNEFINLKEKGYATLTGKKQDFKLRIYPFDNDVKKRIKNITWETRKKGNSREYVGVKASIRGSLMESGITHIELDIYDIDLNNYSQI